jgi:hypothetical protein
MDGSLLSPQVELIGFTEEPGHPESPTDVADCGAYAISQAEALDRLLRTLRTSDVAIAALRDATADEIVHAVLGHHSIVKPGTAERI